MTRLRYLLLVLLTLTCVAPLTGDASYTKTLSVSRGGTGVASTTAYAVLCGGTTSTAALQPVSGVGSSGQVLTSNGAGALPTWQAAAGGSGFYEDLIVSAAPRHDGTVTWTQTAGSWSFGASDPNMLLGGALENTSNAINDEIRKSNLRVPTTGTYAVRLLTINDANRGIISVRLDGVEQGTTDTYSAATTYNTWSSAISLGSLTAGTAYRLDLKVTSKHASSAGYVLSLELAHIYRTN